MEPNIKPKVPLKTEGTVGKNVLYIMYFFLYFGSTFPTNGASSLCRGKVECHSFLVLSLISGFSYYGDILGLIKAKGDR